MVREVRTMFDETSTDAQVLALVTHAMKTLERIRAIP